MRDAYPPAPAHEAHWPPLLVAAVAIALEFLLPGRLTVGPVWLLPGLEALLLVRLLTASPFVIRGTNPTRRRLSLALTIVVSLTNAVSLALLCHLLVSPHPYNGSQLIVAGGLIWLTNVLLFSLWYWELDRGGPGLRAAGRDEAPDLLFPQMSADVPPADWRPRFVDYLYVSLTNAAAFSPTDTMPLTAVAKLAMGLQSLISLVTTALVISRAVNIL